jgi:hypothetical protein
MRYVDLHVRVCTPPAAAAPTTTTTTTTTAGGERVRIRSMQ